jgi:hypothetical protein
MTKANIPFVAALAQYLSIFVAIDDGNEWFFLNPYTLWRACYGSDSRLNVTCTANYKAPSRSQSVWMASNT